MSTSTNEEVLQLHRFAALLVVAFDADPCWRLVEGKTCVRRPGFGAEPCGAPAPFEMISPRKVRQVPRPHCLDHFFVKWGDE